MGSRMLERVPGGSKRAVPCREVPGQRQHPRATIRTVHFLIAGEEVPRADFPGCRAIDARLLTDALVHEKCERRRRYCRVLELRIADAIRSHLCLSPRRS